MVIDTPGSARLSNLLLDWLETEQVDVQALFVGHTHEDSMGGLEVFLERKILTASSILCQGLARDQNKSVTRFGFDGELSVPVGDARVVGAYLGPGHTQDNAVVYLPQEEVLFGGCLIKELVRNNFPASNTDPLRQSASICPYLCPTNRSQIETDWRAPRSPKPESYTGPAPKAQGAGRGNTADADLSSWSDTVLKVARTFPEAETVVPGHGKPGGRELLQYTIEMFSNE